MSRQLIFGETRVPVPEGLTTVDQVRAFALSFLPGLSDAEGFVNADGNFEFRKRAGSKGL